LSGSHRLHRHLLIASFYVDQPSFYTQYYFVLSRFEIKADKMDEYEHYLMNKLKNLLRVSHGQLIDEKLKVLHSG
jgi:hypothetical protein